MTTDTKIFDGIVMFTQVVNAGSFGKAAEAVGHTTSYVSKEITKLEKRLGVRLLNRTTRSLSLTPEGQAYFQQCQQMVSDAEQATAIINQQNLEPRGILKISCPVGFGLGYLQPILSKYMSLYPDVSLELDLNDSKVDVVQDGFDLVIRATMQLEDSSLIYRKIYSCDALIVATKDYLNKHGRPTKPAELAGHNCICYSNHKSPSRWTFVDKQGKKTEVNVHAKITSNSSQMEMAMVKDGHGIVMMPAFNMQDMLKNDEVELLFDDYKPHKIDVFAVYASRKHLSPKVRRLIDLLIEELDKK